MQISTNTAYLLAQHLHWVKNGYDIDRIKELEKVIRRENPISCLNVLQFEKKIGSPINADFDLKNLENLTYLFPNLINFDCNLSFLKYCTNLKTIELSFLKVEDLSDLAYLKSLTKLDLNSTKITSIEPLSGLTMLEELNLENCKPFSLKPLLFHKNLKRIVIDDIEDEEDMLEIVSNQEECTAVYIINCETELQNLKFPKYWIQIILKKESLTIEMLSLMTHKWGSFCSIPSENLKDANFMDSYIALLHKEVDKRIEAVLKSNFEVIKETKYYTNEEVELGVKLEIKKSEQ